MEVRPMTAEHNDSPVRPPTGGDQASSARFEIVLRGYDRRQVEEHISTLERKIAQQRTDLEKARRSPEPGAASSNGASAETSVFDSGAKPKSAASSTGSALNPEMISSFTSRLQSILQAAEEEAEEVRGNARAFAQAEEQASRARLEELERRRESVLSELGRVRTQLDGLLGSTEKATVSAGVPAGAAKSGEGLSPDTDSATEAVRAGSTGPRPATSGPSSSQSPGSSPSPSPGSSQSPGSQSPGFRAPGSQSPGSQSPGSQSPGSQSPGSQSPSPQAPAATQARPAVGSGPSVGSGSSIGSRPSIGSGPSGGLSGPPTTIRPSGPPNAGQPRPPHNGPNMPNPGRPGGPLPMRPGQQAPQPAPQASSQPGQPGQSNPRPTPSPRPRPNPSGSNLPGVEMTQGPVEPGTRNGTGHSDDDGAFGSGSR
jgi:syndecan 1